LMQADQLMRLPAVHHPRNKPRKGLVFSNHSPRCSQCTLFQGCACITPLLEKTFGCQGPHRFLHHHLLCEKLNVSISGVKSL
jgi:hypothetical protein